MGARAISAIQTQTQTQRNKTRTARSNNKLTRSALIHPVQADFRKTSRSIHLNTKMTECPKTVQDLMGKEKEARHNGLLTTPRHISARGTHVVIATLPPVTRFDSRLQLSRLCDIELTLWQTATRILLARGGGEMVGNRSRRVGYDR